MDSEKIIGYIQSPFDLNLEDFNELEEVLIKYPYFQSANMLYVKAAHNIQNENLNKIVSKVSASISNRELLHDLIMHLKKEIPVENREQKEEESDARKEIRERINLRKRTRILQKGEILLDSGKYWHQLIVNEFFTPMIEKLIISPVIDSQTIKEFQTLDKTATQKTVNVTGNDKFKDDRDKRREERMQRRDERFKQKLNQEIDLNQDIVIIKQTDSEIVSEEKNQENEMLNAQKMLEREKQYYEKLKERSEKIESTEEKVEIFTESSKTEEIQPNNLIDDIDKIENQLIKEDNILITSDDTTEILYDQKVTEIESKGTSKKVKLIVEDIPINIYEKTSDNVVIEDIYDKIITSKKVDSDLKYSDMVVEIKDNISGFPKNNEIEKIEIFEDKFPDSEKEPVLKESEILNQTPESLEISIENEIELLHEDIKQEEIITEEFDKGKEIQMGEEKTTNVSDEIFEFIEKKEEIELEKSVTEIPIVEKEEGADITTINKQINDESFVITIPIEKKESFITDKNSHQESIDNEKDTKAANDVFARIEAYKKKKEHPEEQNKGNKDNLIDKFVNEKPSINKITEIKEDEHFDLSENSIKEKPIETELMASIYINQGKFVQAIDIFEKLILKYPEKKDYFATKIEELKNLKG